MPRKAVWPLIFCFALVLASSPVSAQLRTFRRPGTPTRPQPPFGAAREEQQQQAEPFTFQGALPPAPKVPGVALRPGTAPAEDLDELVNQAVALASARRIDVRNIPPWAITHAVLALRNDLVLYDQGRNVNGIEWISNEARFWDADDAQNRGAFWFEATRYGGRAHPFDGTPYEFEGHANQTLALLSMSNLPLTHQFRVAGGRTVTMADMVRHAQMTANSEEEITWTLWFLTQYLDPDSQWVNERGQQWSMEYLVRLQTQAEVTAAPCGGTHGLFALAYVRNSYLKKHGNLRGIWLSADMKLQQYTESAKALQNADGSFSTMFFKGRGQSSSIEERLKTSGHMLEWLMMALPQRRLEEEWVQRGVRALARDLVLSADEPGNCGFVYHSLHALRLYQQRTAGSKPSQPAQQPELASRGNETKTADASPTEIKPLPSIAQTEKPAEAPAPIERPVPAMKQPEIVESPVIAQAKPSVDAAPTAPESGMPPLVQANKPAPTAIAEATPTVNPMAPNFLPPRIAMLPTETSPKPQLLTPVPNSPELARPPRMAPGEPASESAPEAVRIVPGTEVPAEPVEEAPQKLRRTDRLFVPLAPEKLQVEKAEEGNPVPQDDEVESPSEVEESSGMTETEDVTQTAAQAAGPALPARR
ncbi:MAG: hypothetical protein KDA69_07275 [Planctomycetaceae bacterium]|nr:hypothetical protein [Planctomycetaceae bacterium]MCA9044103.1 hypothetical protein [Planctomycetaceae bacterium]